MTCSSNLTIKVVPLCQWAVTLAGKLQPSKTASIMPAVYEAQFKLPLSYANQKLSN